MKAKKFLVLICTVLFAAGLGFTVYAGEVGPGYTGWNQLPDGSWEYYDGGHKIVDQSFTVDGKQYIFDSSGKLQEADAQKGNVLITDSVPGHGAAGTNQETPAQTAAPAAAGDTVTVSQYVSAEWKNRPNPYSTPDVVEVDIPKQHVWCYRNNVLVWDSYCTTGCVKKHTETPRGNFTIQAKQRQRYLMGPKDPATGQPKWKNWVEYWMPFHNGCGLHDASWRKKFAGTIYQYAGSHGCVNLPPERVKDLYDRVYVGMPCIIHD